MKIEELAKILAEQGVKQADLLVGIQEFEQFKQIGEPSWVITLDSRSVEHNPEDAFIIKAYGVRISVRKF